MSSARRMWLGALAFALYAVGAVVIVGRDVVAAPGAKVVGDAGADKTLFMWSFHWWPHAIAHGHDPFAANVVWVPHGTDLAWATTVPLLSVGLTPLTTTAGAIVAYNLAALAAPTLSAWAAYLLARYVTRAFLPSLVAGWLFGFSAFEIGQLVGHLNLVFLVFVPLCGLLALQHLRGDIGARRFVLLLALALIGQFLTSTEIFFDVLLVGVFLLVSAALLVPSMRDRLRATALYTAAASALSLLVVSPYLWHAFVVAGTKSAPLRAPFTESADLLNYVVPTRRVWLQLPDSRHIAHHFTATGTERGAYIGVPLLLIVLFFLWQRRTSHTIWAVALALAAIVVASFGARVHVDGHATVPAPWRALATLPVTRTVLPIRLTLFVALITAVITAVWLADGRGRNGALRWALAAVAIAFVFPNPAGGLWNSVAPNPVFFKTSAWKRQLPAGSTVLVLPFGGSGWSLLWQAEDGFRYRLVDGHFGRDVTPAEERWQSVYLALGKGPSPVGIEPRFREFLRAHGVSKIIVAPHSKYRSRLLVARLGIAPVHSADVLLYRLR